MFDYYYLLSQAKGPKTDIITWEVYYYLKKQLVQMMLIIYYLYKICVHTCQEVCRPSTPCFSAFEVHKIVQTLGGIQGRMGPFRGAWGRPRDAWGQPGTHKILSKMDTFSKQASTPCFSSQNSDLNPFQLFFDNYDSFQSF